MSDLAYIGAGLNLVNLKYHKSVSERYPNLVLQFVYLKDMVGVDPFSISGVDKGKKCE